MRELREEEFEIGMLNAEKIERCLEECKEEMLLSDDDTTKLDDAFSSE